MSGPRQFSFANVQAGTPKAPGAVDASWNEPTEEAAAVPVPRRVPSAKPKNVVKMAKARLREVKSELRRMKALEKERDELERLIGAAEGKPRAVVREIKRSAG